MNRSARYLRALIYDLTSEDRCQLDYHGYCQAHNWMSAEECPHRRAQAFLAEKGASEEPQASIKTVWWCDKEQTQANAIFLQDGTKISIRRENGASWMEIGQSRRVVPMGETFECAWCLEAGEDNPARYVHPMSDIAGYTDTAQPICIWCADGAEEDE